MILSGLRGKLRLRPISSVMIKFSPALSCWDFCLLQLINKNINKTRSMGFLIFPQLKRLKSLEKIRALTLKQIKPDLFPRRSGKYSVKAGLLACPDHKRLPVVTVAVCLDPYMGLQLRGSSRLSKINSEHGIPDYLPKFREHLNKRDYIRNFKLCQCLWKA